MSLSPFLTRIGDRLDQLVLRPEAGVCASKNAPPAGIIVSLSGGPDSVALLLAVRHWGQQSGRPVAAAHLNHCLREAAADADADFCRNLCQRLDVPLYTKSADPRPFARARGQGLEEAGRHLRRTFGEDLLREHPQYGWLTTGHHRDDQVETVLMRLFRGTGPEGLRGIRPLSGVWLHPMLEVDRAEIMAFLEAEGQTWRTDASNLDGDNLRARLRRELLPLARDIFGVGCTDGPARLATLLEDDLTLLETLTSEWLASCRNNEDELRVADLTALGTARARRVLRAWLAAAGAESLARVHIENAWAWVQDGVSGSTLDLPAGLQLSREFDRICWRRNETRGPALRYAGDYRIVVQSVGPLADPVAVGLSEGCSDPHDEANWLLTCPQENLRGSVRIRNWREGDRFQPFGLQGTKKLSDLLRENRITRDERAGVLVVTDEQGILWVVGLARDERTRLLPSTSRTVTISVMKRDVSNPTRDNN
ncbi:MAG: tRNA lysidine(34) synthetase TilS [Candidatus Krumholzibacteria bacterium]|nr:tRNA lysidine(34) synthetase TilS [Candidatus Krumholzibacteria bacterium]